MRFSLRMVIVFIGILAATYLYFALTFQPVITIQYYQDMEQTQVIAHRGGLGERPENTIPAFERAQEIGVDAFELDVHLTRDDVLVVIHDDSVDRTTDASGKVNDLSYDQLREYDAGFSFEERSESGELLYPYRERGVYIPTLEEILANFETMRILLEIKPDDIRAAEAVCQVIREMEALDRVVVSSFHAEPLQHFRDICPDVGTSATENEVRLFFLLNRLGLERLLRPQYDSFALPLNSELPMIGNFQLIDEQLVNGAALLNIPVEVWTVNEEEELLYLLNLGVSGIITDYPSRLLALRKATSGETVE